MNTTDCRLFSVDEIRRMKPGAVFWHLSLGKGILLRDPGSKVKYVLWKKFGRAFLVSNDYPWDQEMKLLHATSVENVGTVRGLKRGPVGEHVEKQLGINNNYQLGFCKGD